jgi:hypothetical protein
MRFSVEQTQLFHVEQFSSVRAETIKQASGRHANKDIADVRAYSVICGAIPSALFHLLTNQILNEIGSRAGLLLWYIAVSTMINPSGNTLRLKVVCGAAHPQANGSSPLHSFSLNQARHSTCWVVITHFLGRLVQ